MHVSRCNSRTKAAAASIRSSLELIASHGSTRCCPHGSWRRGLARVRQTGGRPHLLDVRALANEAAASKHRSCGMRPQQPCRMCQRLPEGGKTSSLGTAHCTLSWCNSRDDSSKAPPSDPTSIVRVAATAVTSTVYHMLATETANLDCCCCLNNTLSGEG